MRTYKEFVNILEQVSGGSLMLTKRFGSSGLGGSTAVTASGQGGNKTQYSVSSTAGRGTVSGQGDKINQGIDAALKNLNSGSNANTSTSTIRTGAIGSLSANVGGASGSAKPSSSPKPEPQSRTQAQLRTPTPVRGPMRPQPTQISTPVPRERAAAFMNRQQQLAPTAMRGSMPMR